MSMRGHYLGWGSCPPTSQIRVQSNRYVFASEGPLVVFHLKARDRKSFVQRMDKVGHSPAPGKWYS